jgi:ABC-type uncharacterized transport system permease subunit
MSVLALVLHFVILSSDWYQHQNINFSLTNIASAMSWLICFGMLSVVRWTPNMVLLPVVLGFCACMIGLNQFSPHLILYEDKWQFDLVLHVGLGLLAYGLLGMAFLYALQMRYINYRLKHKEMIILDGMSPPLMIVEKMQIRLLSLGTLILFFSLLSGYMFLDNLFSAQHAHKTVLSISAFLLFVFVLIGHQFKGWRGKGMAGITVLGMVLLTLAYFGSRFVREVILGG